MSRGRWFHPEDGVRCEICGPSLGQIGRSQISDRWLLAMAKHLVPKSSTPA